MLCYWSGALLLVPAAVVVAFYPMNWILGSVNFYFTSVPTSPIRPLLIIPILILAIGGVFQRRWVFAIFVIPGLALTLTAPDRLGMIPIERDTEISFYPESYNGDVVKQRIDHLDQIVNSAGFLHSLPPSFPPTSNVRSLNDLAITSVGYWRGAIDNNAAIAELQSQIDKLKTQPTQKCTRLPSFGRIGGGFGGGIGGGIGGGVFCNGLPTEAQIAAQIKPLQERIQQLQQNADVKGNFALAISATSAAVVELNAVETAIMEKLAFDRAVPYFVTASISFVLLLYVVGFRNSTLGVLLVGTVVATIFSALPLSYDDYVNDTFVVLYPVSICAVSAFLLRFLFRAFLDNVEIGHLFRRTKICADLLLTALFWLPFPIVVAGMLMFNQFVNTFIEEGVYCRNAEIGICPSDLTTYPIIDSDLQRDTLRDDLHAAITRQLAKFEAEATASAELARPNTEEALDAAKAQIMDVLFKQLLPPNIYDKFPELTPPTTKDYIGFFYFRPQQLAKRIAFQQINKAYQKPRNRFEARLSSQLTAIRNNLASQVGNGADLLKASIKGESAGMSIHLNKSIDSVFLVLNAFTVSQTAFMLLVAMRAYLLGFGRILYRSRDDVADHTQVPYLPLTHMGPLPGKSPKVITEPDDYNVDKQYLPLIAKRTWSANNAKHTTLPFASLATRWQIRRIRHRCLFLRRVIHNPGSPYDVAFTSPAAQRFVVWSVPPHSRVYFQWKQFVAMSENLRLGKDITLRVGALTLGTTMHSYAETRDEPGLLIQVSVGQVILSQTNHSSGAPSQWMSWEDSAKFRIVSSTKIAAMYLDQPQLEPEPKTKAALDVDYDPGLGLISELSRLLKP